MPTIADPPLLYPRPPAYTDRASKARYIATKYAPILSTSVLDVGCDQRQMLAHLPKGVRYTGLDIAPPADVVINLDTPGITLPCADQEFDTVMACDVLEHLERIHAIFDEFCRVAAQRVIISLPNPAHNFVDALTADGGGRLKFYGLPVDAPKDRHRWFFGAEEARTSCANAAAGRDSWLSSSTKTPRVAQSGLAPMGATTCPAQT